MLLALMVAISIRADSVTLCVRDAATDAPLVGASVVSLTDANGADDLPARQHKELSRVLRGDCIRLASGRYVVRRVGYRARALALLDGVPTSIVALTALDRPAVIDTVRIAADRDGSLASRARMSAAIATDVARARGAATTSQLIAQLPFVALTQARGETGLSLRGARREQTAITLDGLPLNDASTGTADVSDVPLAAIGTATVTLGANPLAVGPGASGGALALTTSARDLVSVRAAAFGAASVEAAMSRVQSGIRWSGATSLRRATNAFPFVNAAGATPTREVRANNDEARASAMLSALADRWQLSVLASHQERGMVGAANVHTYDADRAITDRALMRLQTSTVLGRFNAGWRTMALSYRDPTRPVLDATTNVGSLDVDWRARRRLFGNDVGVHVGGGRDDAHSTGNLTQSRNRAFASLQSTWRAASRSIDMGARLDAFQGATGVPSLSASVEQRFGDRVVLGARAAQSMRAPTLYDLYFTSPQRLNVQTLRPERVRADLEVTAKAQRNPSWGEVDAQIALVSRDTRDAIVWFPGNFGWSPANVGRERLRGADARLGLRRSVLSASAWSSWYDSELYTGALIIPTPYTPRWSGGGELLAQRAGITSTARVRLTGRRPYTAGPRNVAFELPAVSLLDLALTHPWPRVFGYRAQTLTTTWSLENATNVAWQSVRGFPSPGRSWAIAFTLQHTPQ